MIANIGYAGAAELLWHAALDTSEAGVMIIDPAANRILQFNEKAMADLTGLEPNRIGQLRVTELFPNQLPNLVTLSEASITNGASWSDELTLLTSDGQGRDVEISASAFDFSGARLLLLSLIDKRSSRVRRSEREFYRLFQDERGHAQRLETIFRDLERNNRLLLDAVGEGIYGVDKNGATTFLNPAAARMLGWQAEELIGQVAHNVMHHTHQDGAHYPICDCPIYAAFHDGAVHHVDNEVFWRKDGTSFPVEYTSTPIKHKGRLVGAVVVFRDVSERQLAETKLKTALAEVEKLKRRLEQENAYLQDELWSRHNHKEIVGDSRAIKAIIQQVELVAPTDANVLITGESGTGKELIARAIHQSSDRRARPLIRVNCAAIPRELFESEFFGHVKGAFTGAVSERIGRFELADGGTIFLDEVGELPLDQQAKLLRVVQEQQLERVGDTRTRKVDVRVIAATNRDLKAAVEARDFREDLFFRLNVFPIEAPPLRKRVDDIALLTMYFVRKACKRLNLAEPTISHAVIETLKSYDWPGNIRELENVIERAVILSRDGKLRVELASMPQMHAGAVSNAPAPTRKVQRVTTDAQLRRQEYDNIVEALRAARGRVAGKGGAAELLAVKPTTLYSRLKRHNIDTRSFKT